ncbi:MAG: hydroxymethylbilane synthase, partial [Pseudomonadota bacterium]
RLEQSSVGSPIEVDEWIPAAAQGAIALECRAGDEATLTALAALDHPETRAELEAERALLAALGGTCHSPVAVLCEHGTREMRMHAAIFAPDGSERVEGEAAFAPGDHTRAATLAEDLLSRASPAVTEHFTGA